MGKNNLRSKEFTIENKLILLYGKGEIDINESIKPTATFLSLKVMPKHTLTYKHDSCLPGQFLAMSIYEECTHIRILYSNIIYIIAKEDLNHRKFLYIYYRIPDNDNNARNSNKLITITNEYTSIEPEEIQKVLIQWVPGGFLKQIYKKRNDFLTKFETDLNTLEAKFFKFYEEKMDFVNVSEAKFKEDRDLRLLNERLTMFSFIEGHPSHISYELFKKQLKKADSMDPDVRAKATKAFEIMDNTVRTSEEDDLAKNLKISKSDKILLKEFSEVMNAYIEFE
jgi:hypothetical protein